MRYSVLCGIGEGGGVALEPFQPFGSRQHSVGVCDDSPVRYSAFCGVGEGGGVALGRFQPLIFKRPSADAAVQLL